MSLNVTDLVHNERITLDPEDILDCDDTELKTKYYNAIINAMGSYSTKPVALKKVLTSFQTWKDNIKSDWYK